MSVKAKRLLSSVR